MINQHLQCKVKSFGLVKKELLKFAQNDCYLSKEEASKIYDECIEVLKSSILEVEDYIKTNSQFKDIGNKIIDTWKLSLDMKTMKEVPVEVIRNWSKD